MQNRIVLVTGGFDPLHSGHIAYFKEAKKLGDNLVVGVNSDAWLKRKKGRAFMEWCERSTIIENLSMVNDVIGFNDDNDTAIDAIEIVRSYYPNSRIVFANGGDRTKENIPEMSTTVSNVEFVFGVGGENKLNSSSDILTRWKVDKVERVWGYYNVLDVLPGAKVKTLHVMPGQTLSMQKHQHRNEYWMVVSGMCMVNLALPGDVSKPPAVLSKYDELKIPVGSWHQLTNPFVKPCTLIEIQYGESCEEEDIERYNPTSAQ